MLRRPRAVRESYVREVLDAGEDARVQQRWLLTQPDEVRQSYVAEVLDGREPGGPDRAASR